jgi:Tol biopolymer transport system component
VAFTASEGTALSFDISPDGSWIVFDLLGQLWRVPIEGGDATPFTHAVRDTAYDFDPSISPDGEWIVFQSLRRGRSGLWRLAVRSGEPRPLTDAATTGLPRHQPYAKATWSPDGTRIAFTRGAQLLFHDLAGDSTYAVSLGEPAPRQVSDPAWLPGTHELLLRQGASVGVGEFGLSAARTPDPVILIDPTLRTKAQLLAPELRAVSVTPSRDGSRLAFFAPRSDEQFELWVAPTAGGDPIRLTDQHDIVPLRARWTPDDRYLLYVAGGRLWRVPVTGGGPVEIPFRAHVEFERHAASLPDVQFAEPATEHFARGHTGLALSPDATRIGIIALGRLWIWPLYGRPHAVARVPLTASGLAWSPDGAELAWAAGAQGAQSLFVTDVTTGETRRLTALPAQSYLPVWSPDGQHIAFVHAWGDQRDARVAIVSAHAAAISDTAAIRYVASLRRPFILEEQLGSAIWYDSGNELLLYGDAPARIAANGVATRPLTGFTGEASFVQLVGASTLVYTQGNRLWTSRVRNDTVLSAAPMSDDAAMYVSTSAQGDILYVSDDGYRLRSSDGNTRNLGWPRLTYRIPEAPDLLIRNIRVWDGTGTPPVGARDILVQHGRIARVAPTGSIRAASAARVIEGDGRTVIPGLIDLHFHADEPLSLAGALYWGVTTILDAGSRLASIAALTEASESGEFAAPRIVYGGLMFQPGGSISADGYSGPRFQANSGTAANSRGLALLRAFGGSFAKMQRTQTLSAGVEFLEHSGAAGLRAGGHSPRFLPLVAAGVNSHHHVLRAEHAGPDGDDLVQLYRHSGIGVIPTLIIEATRKFLLADSAYLERADVAAFLPPHHSRRARAIADACRGPWRSCPDVPSGRATVTRLHEGGVRIGAGTDYTVTPVPGLLHWELEELVAAGLSPADAIMAATSSAAVLLGADAELGTVQPGRWADLLILDADPFADIRNTRRIWHVIKGGQVVDRPALIEWGQQQQPGEGNTEGR